MSNNNDKARSEECDFPDLAPSTAYKRKCRCQRCIGHKMAAQNKYRSKPENRRRYNQTQAALMRKRRAEAREKR